MQSSESSLLDLAKVNDAELAELSAQLLKCNGSRAWVAQMLNLRPFLTAEELFKQADLVWFALAREDWLEGFNHHPRIGDLASLKEKFSLSGKWSKSEQAGVQEASDQVIRLLKEGNEAYERKFGHIFIVCATGKSADEMLALLQARMKNDPARELQIAAAEHAKITRLRLEKLCQQ